MKIVFSEATQSDTVATREHPDLLPLGLNINSLRLLPKFSYTGMYNDNVFADNDFKKSSYVSIYSPELFLLSNWNKHALNMSLTADLGRNHTFATEDYDDWQVLIDGKIDISREKKLSGGAIMARDHIRRNSPSDARGLIPTEYDQSILFGNYKHNAGKFLLDINASLEKRDYHNVPGIRNGQIIIVDNDERDRTITLLGINSSYEFIYGQQIWLEYGINQRDYSNLQNPGNRERSSDGYEALIGVDINLRGLFIGEIAIGYTARNYTDPLPDIDTPLLNAEINWNITDLSTIRLDAKRIIKETFINNFSGFVSTSIEVGVDHELRRNLQLSAAALYISDIYGGVDTSKREDTTYDIVMSSIYIVSRYVNVSAQYHYIERTSLRENTGNEFSDFTNNILMFQLQTQY